MGRVECYAAGSAADGAIGTGRMVEWTSGLSKGG